MFEMRDPLDLVRDDFAEKEKKLQEKVKRMQQGRGLTVDQLVKILDILFTNECKKRLAVMLVSQNSENQTALDQMVKARIEFATIRELALKIRELISSEEKKEEEELNVDDIEV